MASAPAHTTPWVFVIIRRVIFYITLRYLEKEDSVCAESGVRQGKDGDIYDVLRRCARDVGALIDTIRGKYVVSAGL